MTGPHTSLFPAFLSTGTLQRICGDRAGGWKEHFTKSFDQKVIFMGVDKDAILDD